MLGKRLAVLCLVFVGGCQVAEDRRIDAWLMAQQFVKDELKSPGTADFGGQSYQSVVKELGNERYEVNAWVDSHNSFGALIRSYFTCEIEYLGNEKWKLHSLKLVER